MAHGVAEYPKTHDEIIRQREEDALWTVFRHTRGAYAAVCEILVQRGLLAELPKDLDKPIKV
jgi:hypothetical protein